MLDPLYVKLNDWSLFLQPAGQTLLSTVSGNILQGTRVGGVNLKRFNQIRVFRQKFLNLDDRHGTSQPAQIQLQHVILTSY
jgi:hypothetical protein